MFDITTACCFGLQIIILVISAFSWFELNYLPPSKKSPIVLWSEVTMESGKAIVHMQWNDKWVPVFGPDTYYILRREKGLNFFPTIIGYTEQSMYTDITADPRKSYDYWIECGKDAKQTHRRSNPVSAL